jgi:hypothetical protein
MFCETKNKSNQQISSSQNVIIPAAVRGGSSSLLTPRLEVGGVEWALEVLVGSSDDCGGPGGRAAARRRGMIRTGEVEDGRRREDPREDGDVSCIQYSICCVFSRELGFSAYTRPNQPQVSQLTTREAALGTVRYLSFHRTTKKDSELNPTMEKRLVRERPPVRLGYNVPNVPLCFVTQRP